MYLYSLSNCATEIEILKLTNSTNNIAVKNLITIVKKIHSEKYTKSMCSY